MRTLLVLGALLASALPAHAGRGAIAVLPFEVASPEPEHLPLGRGLANMVITDLDRSGDVLVVERERLAELLAELELQASGFVDPESAAQAGKGIGAERVVFGSVTVHDGTMRLDARLVDVETAAVVTSASADGKEEAFFALEEKLVKQLLKGLQGELSADNRGQFARRRSLGLRNALGYGRAVLAYDAGQGFDDEIEDATSGSEEAKRLAVAFEADIKPQPPVYAAAGAGGGLTLGVLPNQTVGAVVSAHGQLGWSPRPELGFFVDATVFSTGPELGLPIENEPQPVVTRLHTFPVRVGGRAQLAKFGKVRLFAEGQAGGLYGMQVLTRAEFENAAVEPFIGASARGGVVAIPVYEERFGAMVGVYGGADVYDLGDSTRQLAQGGRLVPTIEIRASYLYFLGGR